MRTRHPKLRLVDDDPQIARIEDDQFVQTANGLILPFHVARKRYDHPVAIDFFCGAGGMSLGTIQAGFHVVAACDNDPAAAITYLYNLGAYPMKIHPITPEDGERLEKAMRKKMKVDANGIPSSLFFAGDGFRKNHGDLPGVEHFFFGDVRKLSGQTILNAIGLKRGEVDLVMGGPPCQGFSKAGKQNVMDPRNSLIFDYARLVLEISPKTMVMENVPEVAKMITPEGYPVIEKFCQMLEKGGWGDFDALDRLMKFDPSARLGFKKSNRQGIQTRSEMDEENADGDAAGKQLKLL